MAEPARFSLLQVIVGGFALAGAVATITWNIRSDRIEQLKQTIAAYEQSKTIGLTNGLKAIENASSDLSHHLREYEDIQEMKRTSTALKQQAAQADLLRVHIVDLDKQLAEKEAVIRSLLPNIERFRLNRGQARTLAGAQITVGFSADHYGSAELVINNETHDLSVGQWAPLQISHKDCRVVLETYSQEPQPNITVAVYCEK